jgi:hypothetical protein
MDTATASETELDNEPQQSTKTARSPAAMMATASMSGVEPGNAPQVSASVKSPTLSTPPPRRPTRQASVTLSKEVPGFGEIEVPTG